MEYKMEKSKSIMDGKGEWDEEEHPRDEDGKFTEKGTGTAKSGEKEKSIHNLVNALKQVKKIKMKELVELIMSFPAVEIETDDKILFAEFDKFSAGKNVYTKGNSDEEGYKYKVSNIDKIPEIIKSSQYDYSKIETGKTSPQHKGVLRWHYFTKELETERGLFNVVINVRDKGDRQFVYEVSLKKKKT